MLSVVTLLTPCIYNLFLGTSKLMLSLWKEYGYINHSNFEQLQWEIDSINPPANVGHIPGKVSSAFAGFTADQLMLWTVVYSPVVLRTILPSEHYTLWCMFSKACAFYVRHTYTGLNLTKQMNFW